MPHDRDNPRAVHGRSPSTPGLTLCGLAADGEVHRIAWGDVHERRDLLTCIECLRALPPAVPAAPPEMASIDVEVRGVRVIRDVPEDADTVGLTLEALLLALVALEDARVDAVLRSYGLTLENHEGTPIFGESEPR